MFDRVLLLAEGKTAYLDPASEALSFFANQGIPCPPSNNPADFYIHTLTTVPGQEVQSRNKIKAICDFFESSDDGQFIPKQVQANRSLNSSHSQGLGLALVKIKRSPYKASWFGLLSFGPFFLRSTLPILRQPSILRAISFKAVVSFL